MRYNEIARKIRIIGEALYELADSLDEIEAKAVESNAHLEEDRQKLCLSIGEAAELMGISRPTMRDIAEREDFPSFKIGKRVLISRVDLQNWIKRQITKWSYGELSEFLGSSLCYN